ncbi:hypothetical protein BEN47_10825 [Hymenobacter lapidarius]|uniref:Uncharacterized protein n=1 Tax=Hymenobacter lapidarius TaxID=1908237 RepID=A0A1G1T987_9BACT|nr:hypothetical protein [Hymenobacter lapidarius]OGX87415.1 hypothetical protein BEN47_10825 [Hymenobacter lapidarius]
MDQLRMIEYQPRHWRVVYPAVVLQHETLFQQGKALHSVAPLEAERIYRQIMAVCGELHLDAVSHLGMLLNNRTPGLGLTYLMQAFMQARLLFPKAFEEGRDVLLYESTGNGFVLTAYYAMGMELQKAKKWTEALALFEFLVLINPKDNHGAGRWIAGLKEWIAAAGGNPDSAAISLVRP